MKIEKSFVNTYIHNKEQVENLIATYVWRKLSYVNTQLKKKKR